MVGLDGRACCLATFKGLWILLKVGFLLSK